MAGSGMCTGGRIKHHLVKNVSRPESTLVFVGYQAAGTLGRRLVNGEPKVRIHGAQHEVKARVAQIHGLSAHADQPGLLRWLGHLGAPPRRVFLTHGEEEGANRLADEIRAKLGWSVEVPEYQDERELD
jgi:metallo-beta-lactamase family protein